MKKIYISFLSCVCISCLLSACSASSLHRADISNPANTEVDREQLEQYLSENMGKEYVEPDSFCSEVTDGTIFFENGTIFQRKEDGNTLPLVDNVIDYQPFSEHAIIVTHDSTIISILDAQQGILDTLCDTSDFNDVYRPVTGLHTNGTVVYFMTKDQVYRCFVPTKTVDLLATDEMLRSMNPPLSTTDLVWNSYNPVWLKACYELGGEENVYNIQPIFYHFYSTETGEVYTWTPENIQQDYQVEGAEFYYQQCRDKGGENNIHK